MRIHPSYQRRGIGSSILKKIENLLEERQISTIFCIPYAHLEAFYGLIGFRRIRHDQAPQFLQQRIEKYRIEHPQLSYILMARQ